MGTRSITRVLEPLDEEGKKSSICLSMYRQMDGYPSGHGVELFDFLKEMRIVNGISSFDAHISQANGMGCLSAQLVSYFKKGIGQFYLQTAEYCEDQAYNYEISLVKDKLHVTVTEEQSDGFKIIFKGNVKAFGDFVNTHN
tara:strand:+ start:43 stop:465 length:423 start_codon:yes stop_codon:yes gene_type:complete